MSSGEKSKLDWALRQLAEETAAAQASPEVRGNLVYALRRKRTHRSWVRWSWPAAAAACLALGFWLGRDREAGPSGVEAPLERMQVEAPAPAQLRSAEPAAMTAVDAPVRRMTRSPRIEYRPLTPWYFNSTLPRPEYGRVIRMEVSRATAAQFGVYAARASADAEVLIGEDGQAHAIRFVRPVRRD